MNRAHDIVDELLEAMSRRGFFGLLGRGAVAAAVAPAALAHVATAAPAAATAPAAALGRWTANMTGVLNQVRARFIDERVHGFTAANGRWMPPVSPLNAAQRWEKAFPRVVSVLRTQGPGSLGDQRLRLARGPDAPVPEPFGGESAEEWAARYDTDYQADAGAERERIAQEQPQQPQQPQRQAGQAQPQAAQPQQAKKAKRVYPERAARSAEEEDWFGHEQESVYTQSMKAQSLVDHMLDEAYDEHVKAHQLVQKWDGAHRTFGELYKLKHKSLGLFREMGRAIGYERALARVGLTRDDVSHTISGAQIGSTDNYKQTRPVRRCQNVHCNDRSPKPEAQEACLNCGEPLKTTPMGYSFTDLHNKLAKHIMGVETNDGRRVWFDTPVPPQPELEPEEATEVKTLPNRPGRFGTGARGGSWDITKGV